MFQQHHQSTTTTGLDTTSPALVDDLFEDIERSFTRFTTFKPQGLGTLLRRYNKSNYVEHNTTETSSSSSSLKKALLSLNSQLPKKIFQNEVLQLYGSDGLIKDIKSIVNSSSQDDETILVPAVHNDILSQCILELTKAEALLEDLRLSIAIQLATAQSLEATRVSIISEAHTNIPLSNNQLKPTTPSLYELLIQHIDPYSSETKKQLASNEPDIKKKSFEQNDDIVDNNDEGYWDKDFLSDLSEDDNKNLNPYTTEQNESSSICGTIMNITSFCHHSQTLGNLTLSLTKNDTTYPSYAVDLLDYRNRLKNLPVLCFTGCFEITQDTTSTMLLDLKQDGKDITRDTVFIGEERFAGNEGYKSIYQSLALKLMPLALQSFYAEKEMEKRNNTNYIISQQYLNSVKTIMHESTNPLPPNLLLFELMKPSKPASLQRHQELLTSFLMDIFCMNEIRALILLHLVNRTLAGGHSFEKVLNIFGSPDLSLIVPNSQAAQPLNVVILQNYVESNTSYPYAILRSHTNYKIIPAGEIPDSKNKNSCLGEIDACFITDIDIHTILTDDVVKLAGYHIYQQYLKRDQQKLVEFYLPSRLIQWILKLIHEDQFNPTNIKVSDVQLKYRIYVSATHTPFE